MRRHTSTEPPDGVPAILIEVRAPTEQWGAVYRRVAEHMEAGVSIVCLYDRVSRMWAVHSAEHGPLGKPKRLSADSFPE